MNMNTDLQDQAELTKKSYFSARLDLWVILGFTLLNIILLIAGGDTYMLFSAYIPYQIVVGGMLLSGRFPEEFYAEYEAEMGEKFTILGDGALIGTVVVALIIIAVYALFAFLSKKNYVFMVVATALFGLDTLLLLLGFDPSVLVDIVLHVVMLVILVKGCAAGKKLSDLTKYQNQQMAYSAPEGYVDQNVYQVPQGTENGYFTQNESSYFGGNEHTDDQAAYSGGSLNTDDNSAPENKTDDRDGTGNGNTQN